MSDNKSANIDAAMQARKQAELDQARNEKAMSQNTARNTGTGGNTNRFEAGEVMIEGDAPLTLDDIHARVSSEFKQDFESINGGADTAAAVALEAFMHEPVTILVSDKQDDEDLDVIALVVNGMMQPIVRGTATTVKRKYVEALARAKETRYKQVLRDPNQPDSMIMVPRTVLTYPFSVERDDNPNGRDWLREILKQPN